MPGQHDVRILDPYPHRDRADFAAILTYVDDEGMAVSVTCFRYRDERGWKSIKVKRAGLRKLERTHTAAAVGHELTAADLELLSRAADGRDPFPFEEPPEDEKRLRAAVGRWLDRAERDG